MIIPDAAKLLMVMAGFYLYDSALLLYANEAVLSSRRGQWRAQFGSPNVTISGKAVFIASLLVPHRPIFRAAWHDGSATGQPSVNLAAINQSLHALAPFVYASMVAQFFLLPIVLFLSSTTENLIIAATLIYSYIAMSMIMVFRNKAAWGLTTKQATTLGLECLLCPPISLNLVRRISLAYSIREDLSVLAKALMTEESLAAITQQMACQTGEEAPPSATNDAE